MKTPTSITLAAGRGAVGERIGGVGRRHSVVQHESPPAKDTLMLSNAQQKTAWHDLYTKALNQAAPSGFGAAVGAVVPKSVTTAPMPAKAASDVPALKPYNFAMLQKKLVIVNPSDHKIAEVITR